MPDSIAERLREALDEINQALHTDPMFRGDLHDNAAKASTAIDALADEVAALVVDRDECQERAERLVCRLDDRDVEVRDLRARIATLEGALRCVFRLDETGDVLLGVQATFVRRDGRRVLRGAAHAQVSRALTETGGEE